jgi:hypothetical protein
VATGRVKRRSSAVPVALGSPELCTAGPDSNQDGEKLPFGFEGQWPLKHDVKPGAFRQLQIASAGSGSHTGSGARTDASSNDCVGAPPLAAPTLRQWRRLPHFRLRPTYLDLRSC